MTGGALFSGGEVQRDMVECQDIIHFSYRQRKMYVSTVCDCNLPGEP